MVIKINDIQGKVLKVDSIAITLKTAENKLIVIPAKKLISETVEIIITEE